VLIKQYHQKYEQKHLTNSLTTHPHHYQLVNSPLFSTASIAWRVRGFLSEFARFQLVRMDEMLPLEPWLWNGEITLAVFWGEGEKRWIFTKQYGYGSIPIDTFLVG